MNNQGYSKNLIDSARVAVAVLAFAALGGQAVQAGSTGVTMPSQLINPVQTNPYPVGNFNNTPGLVADSFTVGAGSNNLTFTTTNNVGGAGFTSAVANTNLGPQFTTGDQLEQTFVTVGNGDTSTNTISGPLRIDFQTGVAGFGLFAQDYNRDTETFTLNVFNGTTQIGTFAFGPQDNASTARGNAVFVGALSNSGDVITSATLSSLSLATGGGGQPNNGNNDFFFGPTQVQAPVPEASTVVSFGMGVLLFAGLALGAHKRKVNSTPKTASQAAG